MKNPVTIGSSSAMRTAYISGIILGTGAFISFIFLSRTNSYLQAGLIGYFYAVSGVTVIYLVKKIVVSKLKVFNAFQQWILRTFIYTISLSAVYLTGLLFQAVVLKPDISFTQIISERFWSSFVTFVSSPLDLQLADEFLREEFRTLLIPFFAIIILIGLVSILGSYVEIRWQVTRQQQVTDKAQLTALKAQIAPHFIFNSLNSIASLIKVDPERAESLILKLSDILRYIFDGSRQELVPVKSEIDFLKKYADLMQARFENKLQITWQVTISSYEMSIPALLWQPVIENAIKHGPRPDGSFLNIVIRIDENNEDLLFALTDDGAGIHPQRLKKLPISGHALANVSDRLNLTYKRKDLLQIVSTVGQGTEITIRIPKV